MSELYTSSRLRVLRSCLRLHFYRYVLGIITPPNEVMRFGTVGHSALEAYYREWMKGAYSFVEAATGFDIEAPITEQDRYDARVRRLDAALSVISQSDLSPWDRIKLRLLIVAYHERWGGCDWEILAVEQEFRYFLGDVEIGGKIDAIIRDLKDGRVYVVEHKTTGVDASLGGAYWEKLTIDTQVSIYIDGAGMLGYDVAGCIYDVIKRPAHEPKLATPIELRKYTKGRGCKRCGGSGGGKAGIIQGRGHYDVTFASEVKRIDCDECKATGWKCDSAGVPQEPRLYDNQRDTDETVEDFEERLLEVIAENPDAILMRGVVVRLDDELPGMRRDLLDWIAVERTGLTPRNDGNCARAGMLCDFFDACAGRASIDDEQRFPRGRAHPELEAAA